MISTLPRLVDLSQGIKYFLVAFLVLMTIGVTVGLVYVNLTTGLSGRETTEHYTGSQMEDDMDIPDKYPKEFASMLLTTHTHLISFSFIFFFLGALVYMNSIITGFWKTFLMVEPFVSVLGTFGSIWGLRYVSQTFANFTMIFGVLTYITYYGLTAVILYELLLKKVKH